MSRSMFIAAWADWHFTCLAFADELKRSNACVAAGDDCDRDGPDGFVRRAAAGPRNPRDADTDVRVPRAARMPSAIDCATGSLTAPCSATSGFAHRASSIFARLL